MAAVLQHETGLLFIEWYILLTGIAYAVLMIAEPFDYLAVHYGLFHYLFAVLKLYLGVKVAIGFYAHEGTHLAEAVAAALFKAHGLHHCCYRSRHDRDCDAHDRVRLDSTVPFRL